MKLYHYSKPLYDAIRTKANQGKCTPEEIISANEYAKKTNSPGSYHDHVSFFFDPLPLKTLGRIFKGKNDFWKIDNEIYEYTIDTTSLEPNILFYVAESPTQVMELDNVDWIYTDDFRTEYKIKKHKQMRAMGEIGNGIRNLETQIKKYKSKTEYYYLEASKRNDFDDNITMYAASVPHLMLYPTSGVIKIESTNTCIVGNDKRTLVKESIATESVYIDIPKEILEAANNDPILKGYIKKDRKRVGIYYEDKLVGFYQPTEIEYKGQSYARTGNIFVLQEYRNKGVGTKAIIDFFKDKPYGLAYVAINNIPSLKAFDNAGFKRTSDLTKTNPKGVQLYLMIKEPTTKPAFTKW